MKKDKKDKKIDKKRDKKEIKTDTEEVNFIGERTKKRKKKASSHKILATLAFIVSLAYLVYLVISIDSIVNNIDTLSTPLFIFLISLVSFICAIKSSNNKIYILISILIILFTGFNFCDNLNVIKLPDYEKLISYVDKPYSDIKDLADKNDIELVLEYEYSDTIKQGNIIRLSVNEGTYIKDIESITVTISDGPDYDESVIIPSMIGWTIDDVVSYINENFLNNVTIDFEKSDSDKDTIIKQSVNGEIRRSEELVLVASLGNSDLPTEIEMIDLVNKSKFDALLWLKRNNINYELAEEFSDTVESNYVLKQSAEAGSTIATDDKLLITISSGKAITIPDFTSMTVEEATNWIIENKLKVTFNDMYDETVETGKIIRQSIEVGEKVKVNTLVTIDISKGQIKMESFSTLSEFRTWATKYNISYSETYDYSNSISKGNVISYSYSAGEIVDPEDTIIVKISLGKAVVIPSFVGKTKESAQSTCKSLGITCSFVTGDYNSSYNANTVYKQSRAVNSKTTSGSSITLTLSKGAPKSLTFTYTVADLSLGNADKTIENLKKVLANSDRCPGVNFTFKKVKHNTYNSGMVLNGSEATNNGCIKLNDTVVQGNTYTICVVSN